MDQWDDLNTCLLSYFSNAGAVISRLQALGGVPNIREDLMGNHMEVLELIVVNARETLEKFNGIVKALNKALRDTKQMVRGGSALMAKQMQLQWEFCQRLQNAWMDFKRYVRCTRQRLH